ncbi:MAG: tRNA (cytidine(34)-2'-O)-methyltransferase [Pseudomonadota bacterium]
MTQDRVRLALYQPDIAQNTGSILRLCACLDVGADIIEPCGFPFLSAKFRRAGMDYLDQVSLQRHDDFEAFRVTANQGRRRVVLLTTKAEMSLFDFSFSRHDTLLMGRESAGAPDFVHATAHARLHIPMAADRRSLNVAVSAGIALSEALRQTGGFA